LLNIVHLAMLAHTHHEAASARLKAKGKVPV